MLEHLTETHEKIRALRKFNEVNRYITPDKVQD